MKIHEFQAKHLFRQYHIPVPRGEVATTPSEVEKIALELGDEVVVKAQVQAGGRGKAGGIRRAATPHEAREAAVALLGQRLITHQTGPAGKPVEKVLVEQVIPLHDEFYVGIVVDRACACPVVMVSREGGMDIEEVARVHPEKITSLPISPERGLLTYQGRQLALHLGFRGPLLHKGTSLFMKLYQLFKETDASLVEVNPLVRSGEDLVALDAKINLDKNALFRHDDLRSLRDSTQDDRLEVEASKYGLNYIRLEGQVGCMVNGAGLAMATMDLIQLVGASPANFLDVGGGASAEQVREALRILLLDDRVEAILLNIFGGIMRCDILARGVVAGAEEVDITVPMVVRLEGTNVHEGRNILKDSKLKFTVARTMADAAEKVASCVAESNGGGRRK